MEIPNKRLTGILLTATLLLFVPLIAMQFTSEVSWTLSDFAVAAVLLFGTGMLCELAFRKGKTTPQRMVLCAIIVCALVLVWAELAVGVFGTPFAGS